MVWSILRGKLVGEVHEKVSQLRNEITSVKERVFERDAHTKELREQIANLSDELEQLSRRVSAMQRWERDAHQHLNTQQEALIELTRLLSDHLNTVQRPRLPDQTLDRAFSRPSTAPSGRLVDVTTHSPEAETASEQTATHLEEGGKLWNNATATEKELLMKMYDLGYPVSYRELSHELEKSVSTVKNHVNNLKSKGMSFEERVAADNTKNYLLDERVKKFLALKLHT